MPFWAIVYCLMILLSGIIVIFIHKQRPTYYIAGQILSSLLGVLIFVFYYESFFTRPQSLVIIVLMVAYIFYWELWENRYLFPKIQSQGQISSDTEQNNAEFQFTVTKKSFIVFLIGTIAIFLPFLYVVIRLIVSYL
jgi:Ca2+/Na+ antiporter